ncbi:sulfotransferase [Croceicoccus bisphenolivorans]|uniref:sulfotransferase n=1 Tax=Croceicoccus bisphenolivorans TaxID=1783232 RepID=UPI00082DD1B3|nr:sulfotransferase [Croceicoccus bisphenolivorans]
MAVADYNWFDRMVHRLAFGTAMPQDMLSDMEDSKFGTLIAAQPIDRPIFITSLARAGTTLLLEILSRHSALVTHSYRDMPFVLSPIMWRKLSGRFQVSQDRQERAHGDGMMVSADSAEAFEEVLWLKHFAGHYAQHGISVWSNDLPPAFVSALQRHMRALIVSRTMAAAPGRRYLSKNNANIARKDALVKAFPDALFIVPLRHPIDHAQSLLKQHERALKDHGESAFARAYTSDIGHFEFGPDHRPILFPGMEQAIAAYDPTTLDYWLAYWIAAYRQLDLDGQCVAIDMERFTEGDTTIGEIFEQLGLAGDDAASAFATATIRPMPQRREAAACDPLLHEQALTLYGNLREKAKRSGAMAAPEAVT